MQEKIKKNKGFIQIPLLMIVITLVVVVSIGAGVILHKQGKLTPLVATISEVFKGIEESAITEEIKSEETQIEQLETNQEETTQQKLEQAKTENEQLKKEAEETNKLAEEQKQKEIQQSLTYKNNILDVVTFIIKNYKTFNDYNEKLLQSANYRIDSLNDIMSKSKTLFIDNPSVSSDVKYVAGVFYSAQEYDLKMTKMFQETFETSKASFEKIIKDLNEYYNEVVAYNGTIPEENYVHTLTTLKDNYFIIITPEFSNAFFKMPDEYIKHIKESNQGYKDLLTVSQQNYSSGYSQAPQAFYDFSSPYDSMLDNYYKQEQIRALNDIANQLNNIWGALIP